MKKMLETATVAAIATPLGTGGIGVVRISGPDALAVAGRVFTSRQCENISGMDGYTCAFGFVHDGQEKIDETVATVFRAPHSYTGEDVVELSCHGGVYLLQRVLQACCGNGARLAEAGEFTKRAFLNGKLDLTRAEAVADLIAAQGRQAAKAALSAKEGALYRKAEAVCGQLLAQASHLAAWIDYPEEEIEQVDAGQLREELQQAHRELTLLLDGYETGKVVREGVRVVIAGRPNAGKSTLMNLLAGYRRSIVTDLAGTTRDVVSDTVRLGDVVLHLSDTAGIRETDDPVEQLGVELAEQSLSQAQLVLAVFDGSDTLDEDDRRVIEACKGSRCIALINKNDLPQKLSPEDLAGYFPDILQISAEDPQSAAKLEEKITRLFCLGEFDSGAAMLANERQRAAAWSAAQEVSQAVEALDAGISYDAVCVCIERAADYLLELTGKRASQEVVDQVFSRFCVGK